MYGILFKFIGIGLLILTFIYLLLSVFRSARSLDKRVKGFKKDLADGKENITNPYLALSELYAEQEASEKRRRR